LLEFDATKNNFYPRTDVAYVALTCEQRDKRRLMQTISKGITLLGLGPGNPDLLTRKAWEILTSSPELYLRTRQHPVVKALPPQLTVHSFDHFYEQGQRFEDVYARIVETILELGQRPQGVIYAVPGHPFVAETTGPEIARRASAAGIPLQVVEGLSFLEPVFSAIGLDPLDGISLADAMELVTAHVPPFQTGRPALIAQIHSQAMASDVKLTLTALYPDEHPVQLIHAAGSPQQIVEHLALYEIDRSRHIGLLTSLYLPPLNPESSFEAFLEIIAHLRAPDGCPWDRKQTHQTLRPHLIEEAYELLDALDADDPQAMQEEFGDLLLQIVLHAQIASEYGEFTIADVLTGIHKKIVYRHPHVFADLQLSDTESVLVNWEKLKAQERASNGKSEAGLLNGVSRALPALIQAHEYQSRAARVGFDWPDIRGVTAKLYEEMQEVEQAENDAQLSDEIGDLLFSIVNLARWKKIDAESALRAANMRFRHRFSYLERAARNQGRELSDFTLEEMDALWDEVKRAPGGLNE
jgi:tetrapyrrole methylase family protein / MazG family protein